MHIRTTQTDITLEKPSTQVQEYTSIDHSVCCLASISLLLSSCYHQTTIRFEARAIQARSISGLQTISLGNQDTFGSTFVEIREESWSMWPLLFRVTQSPTRKVPLETCSVPQRMVIRMYQAVHWKHYWTFPTHYPSGRRHRMFSVRVNPHCVPGTIFTVAFIDLLFCSTCVVKTRF